MLTRHAWKQIRNFYEKIFWQNGRTEHGQGYVLNYSGIRSLTGANHLWIDAPEVLTPVLIDKATRFFRVRDADWSILTCPQIHPGLVGRCLQMGGFIRRESPILYREGIPGASVKPAFTIQPVYGTIRLETARAIMEEAFVMDATVSERLLRPEHETLPTLHHYLALINRDGDKLPDSYPVALATLHCHETMSSIWNVGTRTAYQKQGAATALMVHLCQKAVEAGCNRSILLAGAMGYGLYVNLGYQHIGAMCCIGMSVL